MSFRAGNVTLPRSASSYRMLAVVLALGLLAPLAFAADSAVAPTLPRDRFRSGEATLRAFAPVSAAAHYSIVKFNVDGSTVALGTVVDTNGLALTKASELKKGKLTCWLATEQEVSAEVLGIDEDEDLALVRVHARGLKPVQWAEGEVAIGQWAITPGIADTPQAVGIISALPHRIRPPHALIGVRFDTDTTKPAIDTILEGLGAEKAGLKRGDIILAVNAQMVTNREQVVEVLREFREGQIVKLRVQRKETQFTVEVRMMPNKAGQSEDAANSSRRFSRVRGDVSRRAEGFEQAIEHDTVLQTWLCGGPLVNLDGKAIGINIARASRVSTYALPSRLVKRVLADLKSSSKSPATAGKSASPNRL
jgi:serine protease Do